MPRPCPFPLPFRAINRAGDKKPCLPGGEVERGGKNVRSLGRRRNGGTERSCIKVSERSAGYSIPTPSVLMLRTWNNVEANREVGALYASTPGPFSAALAR